MARNLGAVKLHLKALTRTAVKPPAAPTFVDAFAVWKDTATHRLGARIEACANFFNIFVWNHWLN